MGSLVKVTVVSAESRTAEASISDSRNWAESASYSASTPVRPPAAPIVATALYSDSGSESHPTIT